MHAVEFETEIVNDTICIPQEYKDRLPHKVRVIIKEEASEQGTIEYLFKDYSGERFKTELTNPVEPIGRELW